MRVAENGQSATTTLTQTKSALIGNLGPADISFLIKPEEVFPAVLANRLHLKSLAILRREEKENKTNPGKPDLTRYSRSFAFICGQSLILLLLFAVLVTQSLAFAPGHSDNHARHCSVCHAAHAPLLTAMPFLALGPPAVRTCWRIAPDPLPSLGDPWSSGACTRGPPALLSAA